MPAVASPARLMTGTLVALAIVGGCASPSVTADVGAHTASPATTSAAGPSASREPSSPTSAPSVVALDTAVWGRFTSDRYDYTVSYPRGWKPTPARGAWTFDKSRLVFSSNEADQIIDPSAAYQILFTAFSAVVPNGVSHEQWIADYYVGTTEGCDPMARSTKATVARLPAVIAHDCNDSQAFVSRGGSIHVFAVWRSKQEPLLAAFLTTVTFGT